MKVLILVLALVVSSSVFAADKKNIVDSMLDEKHSLAWNRFAEQVYALHQQQLVGRAVEASERIGQYGGERGRHYQYREASYIETGTRRLLSRVRWDRNDQNFVQYAEVYRYGDQGRIEREYVFIFLPWGRGTPVQTFVNLYGHTQGLQAYRQFDATGNRIYEQCKGTHAGQQVDISLNEHEIGPRAAASDAYRACFAGVPETAGTNLVPH